MHPSSRQQSSLANEARSTPTNWRRWLIGSGAAAMLFVAMYVAGLFHRGYESKRIAFSGASRIESGRGFGATTMHLRRGQSLVLQYDAEIEHGGLTVRLTKRFAPLAAVPGGAKTIDRSGSGQLRVAPRLQSSQ